MKLFIINQDKFINDFPEDGNSIYKSHRNIHKDAYNELQRSVADNKIPITLMSEYKDNGYVLLDFVSYKNDIYYYEYTNCIS